MLSPASIQGLHDLSCSYDLWLQASMDEIELQDKVYGEEFYRATEIDRKETQSKKKSPRAQADFIDSDETDTVEALDTAVMAEPRDRLEPDDTLDLDVVQPTCTDSKKGFKVPPKKRKQEKLFSTKLTRSKGSK